MALEKYHLSLAINLYLTLVVRCFQMEPPGPRDLLHVTSQLSFLASPQSMNESLILQYLLSIEALCLSGICPIHDGNGNT